MRRLRNNPNVKRIIAVVIAGILLFAIVMGAVAPFLLS